MKKLSQILMMMLVLSVGTGITSCDEIEDMIDNPVVPEPTPTPTPQPEPQPEPQPQPEPEPIVSNLTEELNVASEEGAIVTVNFTMNDVNYELSFKREGNEFVLQNPETLPLMGWPTGLEPQLNLLSDDDDDADTDDDDDTGDDDDDDDDEGDDDGDDSDVDYNYQPGDENIEYESDTTIEADFDGSDDDDDDTPNAGTRVATGITKHYIMVFSIYETATQIDRYQAQWDTAEDSFSDIHPFAMTSGSDPELPVRVKVDNLKVKATRTSKIKTVTYSKNTTGKVVLIKSVTIKNSKPIKVGKKSKEIGIKVFPQNATRTVKLSYNSTIVKIMELKAKYFKYKGLKAGTNKINFVFSNIKQNKREKYTVTVEPLAVSSVIISSTHLSNGKLTLTEGDTEQLTAIVEPNGANKTVTWTTSNESVAKVSSKGLVTAVKAGKATIICHANNGITASCEVTVNAPEDPNSTLAKPDNFNSGDSPF